MHITVNTKMNATFFFFPYIYLGWSSYFFNYQQPADKSPSLSLCPFNFYVDTEHVSTYEIHNGPNEIHRVSLSS